MVEHVQFTVETGVEIFRDPKSPWSYNRNLWMHHLNGDAAYLPV